MKGANYKYWVVIASKDNMQWNAILIQKEIKWIYIDKYSVYPHVLE